MSEVEKPMGCVGPEGLSGWLCVVLFYLLFKICTDIVFAWPLLQDVATDFTQNKGLILPLVYAIFLVVITIKTLLFLFEKSSEFPQAFRNFLLLHVCFGLMNSVVLYSGGYPWAQVIPPTVRELIAFWIGSAYLNQSTRVTATFTR